MNLKVGARQRILQDKIKLVRKLMRTGKVLVKTGTVVKPEDVVAAGLITPGFRSIPLAKSLGVDPKLAPKFLKVELGEKVASGQTLALRKKLFGKIEIKSPIDGIVGEYQSSTGLLRIEFITQKERLTAACWGKVSEIFNHTGVEIETQVVKISGVVGTGRTREGQLKIIGKPTDFLLPSAITQDLADKIIFGGAQITRAALAKALGLGVAGVIAGGIHAEDFFEAGGAKLATFPSSSDVGITLVILEGFGLRPVDAQVFQVLQNADGKFAIISGDTAEVIIPKFDKLAEKSIKIPKEKILAIGDKVRIIDPVHLGLTGKVSKISQKAELTKIGLENFLVEIETDSGKIVQPYTNLEVLI